MDRVTQRRKKGNRLIGQRYLLQTLLMSNSAGTLYQARDMRADEGQDAQVLIHMLPAEALRYTPLKLMMERLQALNTKTDAGVLKVLASGWANSEPYFVLASPASWSLSALPAMLGQTTRLHDQALQLNQRLTEQGLITGALPTSLFLVSADGQVYLPSTALAPSLQNLPESPELLLQAHSQTKPSNFKALPLLGVSFIGVVAASGAGLYYQNYLSSTQTLLRTHIETAQSSNLFAAAANLELPLAHQSSQTRASLADSPKPSPEPEPLTPAKPALTATNEPIQQAEPIMPIGSAQPSTIATNESALTATPVLLDFEPGDMRVALSEQNKLQASSPEAQQPAHNSMIPMNKDETIKPAAAPPKPRRTEPRIEKKPAPRPEPVAEYEEESDPEVNLPSPRSQLIRSPTNPPAPSAQMASQTAAPHALAVVPAPQPALVATTASVLGVVNPVMDKPKPIVPTQPPTPSLRITPEPATERDPAALTANGMSSDELVDKAYQALQANRLDEQPNHGAIYFIRLLDRIDHGNPQIMRLARETSYQLHQQVRNALIQGDSAQASKKLWRAGRIIKEFNLIHLNPAQEILEHKLVE